MIGKLILVIKLFLFYFLSLQLGAVKLHLKLENLKSPFFLGHPVLFGPMDIMDKSNNLAHNVQGVPEKRGIKNLDL